MKFIALSQALNNITSAIIKAKRCTHVPVIRFYLLVPSTIPSGTPSNMSRNKPSSVSTIVPSGTPINRPFTAPLGVLLYVPLDIPLPTNWCSQHTC